MSGTSLQELIALGGWKSYENMVLRYAHVAPEHLSSAAKRIERAWATLQFLYSPTHKGSRAHVSP